MATLKASRQALAAEVDTAVTDTTVDVLAFETPDAAPPFITVATVGTTATSWRFAIRVYVDFGQSEQAQDLLDDIIEAIEEQLASVPRSDWSEEFDELRGMFRMVTVADYPREDF